MCAHMPKSKYNYSYKSVTKMHVPHLTSSLPYLIHINKRSLVIIITASTPTHNILVAKRSAALKMWDEQIFNEVLKPDCDLGVMIMSNTRTRKCLWHC